MQQDYERVFTHFIEASPKAGLGAKVLARIQMEERSISLKRRFAFSFGVFVISAITLVPALRLSWAAFMSSGFYQIMLLVFSDLGMVMNNWKTFTLALLEVLPVFETIGVLAALLVCLWSLKFVLRNINSIFIISKNNSI